MANRKVRQPDLSVEANADIVDILRWSKERFGQPAAERYRTLLIQALRDVAEDPHRPGSKERPEMMVAGSRTYHLSFSRYHVAGRPVVKSPRHYLLYRRRTDGVIEIARILHDNRELEQHLPDDYKLAED